MDPGSRFLRLGNLQAHLDLEELERTPVPLPSAGDVRVSAALQIDAFSGKQIVWLSRDELEAVAAQLLNVFDGRSDEASLRAMSPDDTG